MELIHLPATLTDWIAAIGVVMSLGLIVFLPIELLRLRRQGKLARAAMKEMLTSASPVVPTILTGGVVLAFITSLYTTAAHFQWSAIATTPLSALLCLLLVDLLYYLDHRSAHRVRAYWSIAHSVHHSSHQYDQTTALRVSFVDGFISPWFYLPAVLIGFDPLLVGASLGFILGYQQWVHTESVGKLPWLDSWLNTPSNHRVHHGAQKQYLDKNYGAVLMIWDRIFGSYEPEVEPVRYGLTEPIGSSHPWTVHVHEAKRLLHDVWQESKAANRWRMLWKPPGWRAEP